MDDPKARARGVRARHTKQMPGLANAWLQELQESAVPPLAPPEGMEDAFVAYRGDNVIPSIPTSANDPNACVSNGRLLNANPLLRPHLICLELDYGQIVWIRVGKRPTDITVVQKPESIKGVISGLTSLEGGRMNIDGLQKLLPFIDPGSPLSVFQQLYFLLDEIARKEVDRRKRMIKLIVVREMPPFVSPGSPLSIPWQLDLPRGISEEDKKNAAELIEAVEMLSAPENPKTKKREILPAPLESIDYAIGLLRYHRPGLFKEESGDLESSKPDEEERTETQRALVPGACQKINELLVPATSLNRFLEFGRPQKDTTPSTKNPSRNVEAAVLADIHGLTKRQVTEQLSLKLTDRDKKKGEYDTAKTIIAEGRKLLKRAFGEEAWGAWVESARTWLEQYIEEYKQADHLRVPPDTTKDKILRKVREKREIEEEKIGKALIRERAGLPGGLSEQARERTARAQIDELKRLRALIEKA